MPSKRIEEKLASLTRAFFANHPDVRLIAVTGSAGKASTKLAIANVLSKQFSVQLREEEPLTKADVFMQIMGVKMPTKGLFKWARVISAMKKRVSAEHPDVQVIVQEFNPQNLGYNQWFSSYVVPDITVLTSVTSGRMEVNYSLEQVAEEMITLANNSRLAIINRDDVEGKFAGFLTNPHITTYGMTAVAEYHFDEHDFSMEKGYVGSIISPENNSGLSTKIHLLGDNNIRPAVAAAAVAYKLGVAEHNIISGVDSLQPLPGRMRVLAGADDTWLIDDSYSSSPVTALSALQTLYAINAPQRISVLGNMNGLKGIFEHAHQELGSRCTPELLDWVVTVGEKANKYIAPAARQKGCQVKECVDAIEAGAFIRDKLKPEGIALFKGSRGGVWLEEAVKINLKSTSDEVSLVRQDPEELAKKQAFFTANRIK